MKRKSFRAIKPEIRVIGIDDGAFKSRLKGKVPVIGVIFRGGFWLDGVIHTRIAVDGIDATEKIASMIIGSSHYKQLRVIMLNGVTFAGFNIVDVEALHSVTKLPIITVTREKPDFDAIHKALKNLPKSEIRWKAILGAGDPIEISTRSAEAKVYVQTAGLTKEDAQKILRLTSTRSNIPEALRVAHLIASGITRG